MQSHAKRVDVDEMPTHAGTLVASGAHTFTARMSWGEVIATRAVSCLVEPVVGDRVLVAVSRSEAYVLAVLARDAGHTTRIVVDGDTELRVNGGRLVASATEGIDLAGGKDVSILSAELNVNAINANVVLDRIAVLGSALRAEIGSVKLVGDVLDAVVERVSQRVKRSFRRVEDLDEVRAGRVDYAAEKSLCLKAENAVIDADQLVKIDGDQIHIG